MPDKAVLITDPTIGQRIVEALRLGAYREEAAGYGGVDSRTVARWVERGEKEAARIDNGQKPDPREVPFVRFADTVKSAEAEARIGAIKTIREAMSKNWVAAMTFLERKDPRLWGRRDRSTNVNVNVDAGKLDLSGLSDAEVAQLNAILAKLTHQDGAG